MFSLDVFKFHVTWHRIQQGIAKKEKKKKKEKAIRLEMEIIQSVS